MEEHIDVTEHLGLVDWVIHRMVIFGLEREDARSIGYMALVKAAQTYDPSKSTWATHATFRIRHAILDELRKIKGRYTRRPNVASLETLMTEVANFDIEDPDSDIEISDDRYAYRILNSLSHREQTIIKFRAIGYTYFQIAQELGISESRVNQIVIRMRERLAS